MYKYKQTHSTSCNPILDPDYNYHSSSSEEEMYDYFKQLHIVENATHIIGIYIQFYIQEIPFEKYPPLYIKISQKLEIELEKYFDFGNANLFSNDSHFHFITMFDASNEEIEKAFFQFHKKVNPTIKFKHKTYSFHIHCGVYISHPYIAPFSLLTLAKEQYENTLKHSHSFFSIKTLYYPDEFDDGNKNNESNL